MAVAGTPLANISPAKGAGEHWRRRFLHVQRQGRDQRQGLSRSQTQHASKKLLVRFAYHYGWVFFSSLIVYLACVLQPFIWKNNSKHNSAAQLVGGCCMGSTQELMAPPGHLPSTHCQCLSSTRAAPQDADTACTGRSSTSRTWSCSTVPLRPGHVAALPQHGSSQPSKASKLWLHWPPQCPRCPAQGAGRRSPG